MSFDSTDHHCCSGVGADAAAVAGTFVVFVTVVVQLSILETRTVALLGSFAQQQCCLFCPSRRSVSSRLSLPLRSVVAFFVLVMSSMSIESNGLFVFFLAALVLLTGTYTATMVVCDVSWVIVAHLFTRRTGTSRYRCGWYGTFRLLPCHSGARTKETQMASTAMMLHFVFFLVFFSSMWRGVASACVCLDVHRARNSEMVGERK